MAGERTPDTSSENHMGSSDDDISLREHLQRQLDTLRSFMLRLDEDQAKYFERVLLEQGMFNEKARTDLRDLLDQRFAAQQGAVDELKTTTAQRFEGVNEFRAQLSDQARTFMGRDESISRHERTSEQIASLTARNENEMRLLRGALENETKVLRDRHDNDIAGVNSRLDIMQGAQAGQRQQVVETRDTSRYGLQIMAGIIGLVMFVVAILQVVLIVKK